MKHLDRTWRRCAVAGATVAWLALIASCTADATSEPGGSGGACTDCTGGGGGGGATGGGSAGSDPTADQDGDGYNVLQGDCNDHDAAVHPGAEELCSDGVDNNCNGATDSSEPDGDGDGFGPCQGDCDDGDASVSPSADEIAGDGIDNDCDGVVDADFDGDGVTVADGDCDDADAPVYPGAEELCFDNIDNDCDEFVDALEPDLDGDGFGPCTGDCAEGDANVGPGMPELPGDGIDNNCDNLIDLDIDGDGWTEPNGDCDDADPAVNPSVLEVCGNLVDDDCDGIVDTDCVTGCELAAMQRSSVGCVYYAVDQDNFTDMQYAVVVSNVDPQATASVEVQQKSGNVWNTIQSAAVGPGGLHQFNLPDFDINGTGLHTGGAYKIVSDSPVIAYEFNPIEGQSSYTSDASLLLPVSALDRYHYVLGWAPASGLPQLVVVASEDDTVVTITPTASTNAGGGLPALTAGVPYTFPQALAEGDVLQLEATASLTGTYITSDKPVAVFSAHDCANIPVGVIACDHLEEQLFGLQTWGQRYVAARMPVRDANLRETTLWQILASEPNTTVSFFASPQVTGLPAGPQVLAAGQALELWVSGSAANPGDFVIEADRPILVMEYLTGRGAVPAINQDLAGDPAMTQAVPTEQFLDHYVVLVPASWVLDFAILTKPVGATVTIDGVAVPQGSFIPITDGNQAAAWEVARVPVADGVHTLDGTALFGIVVVGYDFADSYAYPGGLDQQLINPIN